MVSGFPGGCQFSCLKTLAWSTTRHMQEYARPAGELVNWRQWVEVQNVVETTAAAWGSDQSKHGFSREEPLSITVNRMISTGSRTFATDAQARIAGLYQQFDAATGTIERLYLARNITDLEQGIAGRSRS
jgi:hypothetical protein